MPYHSYFAAYTNPYPRPCPPPPPPSPTSWSYYRSWYSSRRPSSSAYYHAYAYDTKPKREDLESWADELYEQAREAKRKGEWERMGRRLDKLRSVVGRMERKGRW